MLLQYLQINKCLSTFFTEIVDNGWETLEEKDETLEIEEENEEQDDESHTDDVDEEHSSYEDDQPCDDTNSVKPNIYQN